MIASGPTLAFPSPYIAAASPNNSSPRSAPAHVPIRVWQLTTVLTLTASGSADGLRSVPARVRMRPSSDSAQEGAFVAAEVAHAFRTEL